MDRSTPKGSRPATWLLLLLCFVGCTKDPNAHLVATNYDVDLYTWDDVDAGVRCYWGDNYRLSCVKVRP
jgi:hypothetical protein